jgi:chromosomal replication initiation ATPase DnaA
MTQRNAQLVLALPHREAMGRDDFLVTKSNEAAVALMDAWPHWSSNAAVLVGPPGSGKSHLAEVWRQRSGAVIASASALTIDGTPPLVAAGAMAIEDLGRAPLPERALFHLLNLARQQDVSVLMTAETAPESWAIELADLRSRLMALPVVAIQAADDELLRGVLVKLFMDRQLALDEGIIAFIMARMPRSLDAARLLVAEVDRRALVAKAEITRPFVAKVLHELTNLDLFGERD